MPMIADREYKVPSSEFMLSLWNLDDAPNRI